MPAEKPEMGQRDQVRMIGSRICRFANGTPCLCFEKDKALCQNVRVLALECWELAHKKEMDRETFNKVQKRDNALAGPAGTTAAPKKVRKRG